MTKGVQFIRQLVLTFIWRPSVYFSQIYNCFRSLWSSELTCVLIPHSPRNGFMRIILWIEMYTERRNSHGYRPLLYIIPCLASAATTLTGAKTRCMLQKTINGSYSLEGIGDRILQLNFIISNWLWNCLLLFSLQTVMVLFTFKNIRGEDKDKSWFC
jgi:hypothetical protein